MTQPKNMSDGGSGRAAQSMMPALLLGMAGFLTNFDVTAVVIALPTVARELGLEIAGYAWVMDAYSLAFTACLLFAGALADRYGRRRAMLVGNGIFALASLACGMAWDGPTLLVARVMQGIGAAFIVTGGFALIASVYVQARARTDAFALVGVMSGVAMAFGPTMGGLVSSWIGWRWIFLINLPVCALVAWGVPRLVAEAREAVPRPLDPLGVVLFTSALTALVEALLHGRTSTSHMVAGLALSAVLLAAFGLQQRSRDAPILDPGIFVQPAMIGIAILLCAVSIGYWAILVYLPLFFAAAFDWSSEVAGIALLTATLPMLFLPPSGRPACRSSGMAASLRLGARDSGSRQCRHCDRADLGWFSAAADSDFLRDCRDWGRRRFGSPATVRRGRVARAAGSCRPGICRDRSSCAKAASRSASRFSARCFIIRNRRSATSGCSRQRQWHRRRDWSRRWSCCLQQRRRRKSSHVDGLGQAATTAKTRSPIQRRPKRRFPLSP
jgi:MFS family permease